MHSSTTRSALIATVTAVTACTLASVHLPGADPIAPALRAQAQVQPIPLQPSTADVTRPVAATHPQVLRDQASLSGQAMPLGDRPGWHQQLWEDFTGRALPNGWVAYSGRPGGNSQGWWKPSQVRVRDGKLVLAGSWQAGRYVTGGVMAVSARATYGKYEVRFRVPRSQGVKYALLLWPSAGGWPAAGEVDFAEDGDGDRRGTTATLHHGARNEQVQRTVRADFSSWQTVGVEWTPRTLVYTLNGKRWASIAGSAVPSGPMDLALQLEAGSGDQWSAVPDARTPARTALEVDWAVSYRRA